MAHMLNVSEHALWKEHDSLRPRKSSHSCRSAEKTCVHAWSERTDPGTRRRRAVIMPRRNPLRVCTGPDNHTRAEEQPTHTGTAHTWTTSCRMARASRHALSSPSMAPSPALAAALVPRPSVLREGIETNYSGIRSTLFSPFSGRSHFWLRRRGRPRLLPVTERTAWPGAHAP